MLHKIAEAVFLLVLLQFLPGVRAKGIVHFDSILFELDERAAPLSYQSLLWLLGLHAGSVGAFDTLSLSNFSDLD